MSSSIMCPISDLHSTVVLLKGITRPIIESSKNDLHSTVVLLKVLFSKDVKEKTIEFTFYCSSIKRKEGTHKGKLSIRIYILL